MESKLSEFDLRMLDHFKGRLADQREVDLLAFLLLDAKQSGFEDEYEHFVKENPEASIDELCTFAMALWPPLEIVDDEELDEDERTD